MKTLLTMLAFILAGTFGADAQSGKSLQTDTLKVYGNCGMCKSRIEKAAHEAGAKTATWNNVSSILSVSYVPKKTSLKQIEEKISLVGHDTQNATAPDSVYETLHECCKYDRKTAATKQ